MVLHASLLVYEHDHLLFGNGKMTAYICSSAVVVHSTRERSLPQLMHRPNQMTQNNLCLWDPLYFNNYQKL